MLRLIAVVFFGLMVTSNAAHAAKGGGLKLLFNPGKEITHKTADLPDTAEFEVEEGFLDIGVIYKDFEVLFLPLWQYDFEYVGVVPGVDDTYYTLTEADLADITKSAGISLPPISEVKLDFWTAWGGKIVVLLVIVLFIAYRRLAGRVEAAQ